MTLKINVLGNKDNTLKIDMSSIILEKIVVDVKNNKKCTLIKIKCPFIYNGELYLYNNGEDIIPAISINNKLITTINLHLSRREKKYLHKIYLIS